MKTLKGISSKMLSVIISFILSLTVVFSAFSFPIPANATVVSEAENNNEYATANNLVLNSTIKGDMNSTSDEDCFKITPSQNGEIALSLTHAQTSNSEIFWDIAMYAYESGGYNQFYNQRIYANSGDVHKLASIGVASGTVYYIKVSTYWSATIDFEYNLTNVFNASEFYEKEINDEYSSATSASFNKTYGGVMNDTNDVDIYKFSSSQNGEIALSLTHAQTSNSEIFWDIAMYAYESGSYNQFYNQRIYANSGDVHKLASIGLSSGKAYYVKISTYWNATVGFDYKLNNEFKTTDYYEKETNDEYSTATAMSYNQTYGGVMNDNNDVDIYKFSPSQNGEIALSFTHAQTSNSEVFWDIAMYAYESGEYTQFYNQRIYANSGEIHKLASIGAASGTVYYIKISTYWNATVAFDYKIKNEFHLTNYFEKEINDEYSSATPIVTNVAYSGVMNDNNDIDKYKITVSSTPIPFTFSHNVTENSEVFWDVKIVDGSYEEVFSERIYGSDNSGVLTTLTSNGTYYIQISTYWNATVAIDYSILIGSSSITQPTDTIDNPSTTEPTTTSNSNPLSSPSGFTLLKDNNSFFHANGLFKDTNTLVPEDVWRDNYGFERSKCGFLNKNNYYIDDYRIRERINYLSLNKGRQSLVQEKMNDTWNGSCYGIAATMGLVYNNALGTNDLGGTNSSNYYSMPLPYTNTRFIDSINFYYLSQFVDNYGSDSSICTSGVKNIVTDNKYISWWNSYLLNDYYELLINDVKKNGVMLLGYFYTEGKEKHGHAILTCGIEQLSDGTNDICLYDENNSDSFDHLYLWKNKNGKYDVKYKKGNSFTDLADRMTIMYHIPLNDTLGNLFPYKNGSPKKGVNRNEFTTILVNGNDQFNLKNKSRENVISYNGDSFDTDKEIKDLRFITNDANGNSDALYEITVDKQDELFYNSSNESTDFTIIDNDDYFSVKGDNIDSVNMNSFDDVEINGSDYSFEVSLNRTVDGENQVVSIEGNAEDDVTIYVDKNNELQIDSDATIKDVSIEINNNFETSEINADDSKSITVKENGEHSENAPTDATETPTQPITNTLPTNPVTEPTEETTEMPNTTLPTEPFEPVVEPTEPATKATSPLDTPKLKKRNNPIKVTVKTKSVKKKKLKSKKQTVKPLSITKAQGKYSVSLVKSGTTKKIRSKILVNKKGVITFKKGKYKKGTYKVKLKIYVKGNAYYKSKTVTKTAKVKVK